MLSNAQWYYLKEIQSSKTNYINLDIHLGTLTSLFSRDLIHFRKDHSVMITTLGRDMIAAKPIMDAMIPFYPLMQKVKRSHR